MNTSKAASFAFVLMLTATSLTALFPAAGQRGGSALTVTREWNGGPYNSTPGTIVNDTDGDGQNELVLWLGSGQFGPGGRADGENWIQVYDLPGYTLAWMANFTQSFDLELVDAGQNGSVQILLTEYGELGTTFELISGKGYQSIWKSPAFSGSIYYRTLAEVDADGDLELVFGNETMTGDKLNFTYDSRIQIYNLESGQEEWESAGLDAQIGSMGAANIDADPALEILMITFLTDENYTQHYSLSVFDGATHSRQWTLSSTEGFTGLSLAYVGDVEADRAAELVVQFGQGGGREESRTGFLVLSGSSGAEEWGLNFTNASLSLQVADIDNDTVLELLVSLTEMDEDYNSNLSFLIYDLKSHDRLWSLGPFPGSIFMGGSSMYASDLDGDGIPEIIIQNNTYDFMNGTSTNSWDVYDGQTFSLLWDSPEFSGFGYLQALPLDTDSQWEIMVPESWTDADGNDHGLVHIFASGTYTEEWKTGDYGCSVSYAYGVDVVNDSRLELLIMLYMYDSENDTYLHQLLILDPDTHAVLWYSPKLPDFQPYFATLYGSPKNEIILISQEGDPRQGTTSRLLVFNDTTFEEAWRSDILEGSAELAQTGDFDSDTPGELLVQTSQYDMKFSFTANLTVFEFYEAPLQYIDLSISNPDLSLSSSSPSAGMRVFVTARVHNLGDANATGACVTLSADGTPVASATVDVPAGGTVPVELPWTARVGDHVLTVRLDPRNLLAESNENNNIASLNVSVSKPARPVAVISSPAEGQQFAEGAAILFDGSSSFAPEGSTYFWTSEQDGYLGSTDIFNLTLPAGDHYVILYIDDGQFNVSAMVNFSVNPGPPPPGTTWAVISSPRNGAVFTAGDEIALDGSRSTPALPEYTLTYQWSSNLSGALGNLSKFSLPLPAGLHQINLAVDDGHGGNSSASVNIRVREPIRVNAVISSPGEGQSFEVGTAIQFDGSGSTGPAGAILTYMWTSNLTGPLSTQKAFSFQLAQGSHAVTLNVSDGQGHFGTAVVNLTLKRTENHPPTATIDFPANGSTVSGIVTLEGTAWDDQRVVAVYLRIDQDAWGSVSGTTSWHYSWNTNTSKIGNGVHRITVKSSDGTLNSEEVSINVTVNNTNPPPPVKPAEKKTDNTMLLVGIGAVAVIIAVGVAAAAMMRKRKT